MMMLYCRLSLLLVYLLNLVRPTEESTVDCNAPNARRLEDLNEPPLNTPYDVCVVADSHIFIAIKPSGGSGGDSFGFNSCFNGDSNFAQFFNLNDGSEKAERVNTLLDGSEQCVLQNQAYGDVRDAIQRAGEEWPGLYDLALRNCAPRILLALELLFHDAGSNTALLDYLSAQLHENGVGALAKADPQVVSTLYGQDAEANSQNSEQVFVDKLIEFTIENFNNCGDGVVTPSTVEECDEGVSNGSEDSECSSFCSFKEAWYCPSNFEVGDKAFSCKLKDNIMGCDNDCARNLCEVGSEYSGPGTFDEPTSTCNFTPCPWFRVGVRLNETHCVSGLSSGDGQYFFSQVKTYSPTCRFTFGYLSPILFVDTVGSASGGEALSCRTRKSLLHAWRRETPLTLASSMLWRGRNLHTIVSMMHVLRFPTLHTIGVLLRRMWICVEQVIVQHVTNGVPEKYANSRGASFRSFLATRTLMQTHIPACSLPRISRVSSRPRKTIVRIGRVVSGVPRGNSAEMNCWIVRKTRTTVVAIISFLMLNPRVAWKMELSPMKSR